MADAAALFKKKKGKKAKKSSKFNANKDDVSTSTAASAPRDARGDKAEANQPVQGEDGGWATGREIKVATGGRDAVELLDMEELMQRDEQKELEEQVARKRAQEEFRKVRAARQQAKEQAAADGGEQQQEQQEQQGPQARSLGLRSWSANAAKKRAELEAARMAERLADTNVFPDLATAATLPKKTASSEPSRPTRPRLFARREPKEVAQPAKPAASVPKPVVAKPAGVWGESVASAADAPAEAPADAPAEAPAEEAATEAPAEEAATEAPAEEAATEAAGEAEAGKVDLAAKFGAKKKKKPKKPL